MNIKTEHKRFSIEADTSEPTKACPECGGQLEPEIANYDFNEWWTCIECEKDYYIDEVQWFEDYIEYDNEEEEESLSGEGSGSHVTT